MGAYHGIMCLAVKYLLNKGITFAFMGGLVCSVFGSDYNTMFNAQYLI